ncbi:hypothetical protein ACSLBF_21075 (plasmid) [Pseudoalteromonas sp. T1lg65]|uniref:hypothetical protein n=1 Tax=Pseudoalteromonas sp. T1lg65 TaxID=2077101 RepID=UPI003F7B2F31
MKNKALWSMFCFIPLTATMAKEFNLNVNFESIQTALEILEVNKIQFPDLSATPATTEGAVCNANGIVNDSDHRYSLCPGSIAYPGLYRVTGAAGAAVVLTHTADQTINGLRLTTNQHATPIVKTLTLDSSGEAQYNAQSIITLIDKDSTQTAEYHFTFDISVAYQ